MQLYHWQAGWGRRLEREPACDTPPRLAAVPVVVVVIGVLVRGGVVDRVRTAVRLCLARDARGGRSGLVGARRREAVSAVGARSGRRHEAGCVAGRVAGCTDATIRGGRLTVLEQPEQRGVAAALVVPAQADAELG